MARFGRGFPMPRRTINRPPIINFNATGTLVSSFSGTGTGVVTLAATGSLVVGYSGVATVTIETPSAPFTFARNSAGQLIWHGLSDQFIAAVSGDYRWLAKIQVFTAAGTFLADITSNVVGGNVTVDETAQVRRICTLNLEGSTDLIPMANIINQPVLDTLLHPATGNELHISRGVQYPDGVTEFAQLGVFRMTKPAWDDDGALVTATINGQDRSSVVSRIDWQVPYPIKAGTGIGGVLEIAIMSILTPIYGTTITPDFSDAIMDATVAAFSYPDTTFGADPSSSGNPMQDFITFAATAGCELFFDVFGNPIMRKIVNPSDVIAVDNLHLVEGQNCVMIKVGRNLDESTAVNQVIVYCNGLSGATPVVAPFTVTISDTTVGSPTNINGPWGKVPFKIVTTTIPAPSDTLQQATSKAALMAAKQLRLMLGSFDNVNLSMIPNPALREGDGVLITRERMRISDTYVISQMDIPLDPAGDMTVTFRPQVDVVATT